ncbi:MAG: hypothetical protein SGJ27_15750 [Candidatus Melainabacteria bacterium]|nr:hypothetical protein [Candidatus Melainabacteria bacterium]
MHPYWIQKIEESRRSSVTTFWTVIFLVVILPIVLVMKLDPFFVIAIVCFVLAGLRVFSQGKSEMAQRAEASQAKLQRSAVPESGASGLSPEAAEGPQWQSTQPNSFPGPQYANGVQTTREYFGGQPSTGGVPTDAFGHATPAMAQTAPVSLQQTAPEGFFTRDLAPGQHLAIQQTQNFSAQQETGPMPASPEPGQPLMNAETNDNSVQPNPAHPNRPMHFHDLARH